MRVSREGQPRSLRRVTPRGILAFAAVALLGAALPLLGPATPAEAHTYLVSSTPAAGATLTALPDVFEVTTNEPLLTSLGLGGFALDVVDAEGLHYGEGCVTVDGTTMSSAVQLGAPGEYTLIWQVVATDSHTVSEEFTFEWAPEDGSGAASGSATAARCSYASGGEGSESSGPSGSAPARPDPAAPNLTDVFWIAGEVGGVAAAVAVTLFALSRKKRA